MVVRSSTTVVALLKKKHGRRVEVRAAGELGVKKMKWIEALRKLNAARRAPGHESSHHS